MNNYGFDHKKGVESMSKKDLDWANIGFQYRVTDKRYVSNYKDGAWDEGGLTEDSMMTISESANIMQYCQEVFEGMKAYTTVDGKIVTLSGQGFPDPNNPRIKGSYVVAVECDIPKPSDLSEDQKFKIMNS